MPYLANLACITPHIWLSRADKLYYPDKIIIDLDPTDDFEHVRSAAFYIKEVAENLKLRSFIMLTGSRGLHVAYPLIRNEGFDEARSFSQELAKYLINQNPDLFTIEEHKDKRRGRFSWILCEIHMVKLQWLRMPLGPDRVLP